MAIIVIQKLNEVLAVSVWNEEPIDWQLIKFKQKRGQ